MPIWRERPSLAELQQTARAVAKSQMTSRLDGRMTERQKDARALDAWRNQVFARDGLVCRCCGRTVTRTLERQANRAESHHIESRKHKPTRHDVRNGITLCAGCHAKVTGTVGARLRIIGTRFFIIGVRRYVNAGTLKDGPIIVRFMRVV